MVDEDKAADGNTESSKDASNTKQPKVIPKISGTQINNKVNKKSRKKSKMSQSDRLQKGRRRRLILRVVMTSSIITALLVALFLAVTKVNFRISDELSLELSPSQQSAAIPNTGNTTITFSLKNNNLFQCNAVCNFTLYDFSQDTTTYHSVELLKHKERVEKSFDVNAQGKGSGQLIYRFEANCNNVRTLICLTNEEKRLTSSVAIINYELSSAETIFRDNHKSEILDYLQNSSLASQRVKKALESAALLPINMLEARELKVRLEELNSTVMDAQKKADAIRDFWNSENYLAAESSYSRESLKSLQFADEEVIELASKVDGLIGLRNQNIDFIKEALQGSDKIVSMSKYYQPRTNQAAIEGLSGLSNYTLGVQQAHASLAVGRRHSEAELNAELSRLRKSFEAQHKQYLETKASLYLQNIHSLNLLSALSDAILDNYSIASINITPVLEQNSSKSSQGLQNANLRGTIGQACQLLNSSIATLLESNKNALALREQSLEASEASLMRRVENGQNSILSNALKNAILNIEIEPTLEEDAKTIVLQLAKNISVNDSGYSPTAYEASLAIFSLQSLENVYSNSCLAENISSALNTATLTQFTLINPEALATYRIRQAEGIEANASTEAYESKINLQENPPICCLFSECKACCTTPDCAKKDYPTIFVHGHAFNERNTPELSLSLFSKLQQRMEKDKYLNLARLDLREKQLGSAGVFGYANVPVTMTASYYYITHYQLGDYSVSIRNDEGLETYSIRLKEIIDDVKWKTGKDKVNIVAHSMGGLVAREYVYLFSASDVSKLITINTPHNGVSGRAGEWCSVLGAKKECRDLQASSIFLNRLNSKPVPIGLKIYSIRSTGCLMDGGVDGDGIVTGQSATLEGAANFEIRGNCTDTLRSNLHNNALNPELYPEMYSLIYSLLRE